MNTIPATTQALLQRLDEGYAGISPDDIDAGKAIWRSLLDDTIDHLAQEQPMTTETHIAGLERRIADMEQRAENYELAAIRVEGTGPAAERARTSWRVSATSCRRDAMQCRAKIAELRALALEAA